MFCTKTFVPGTALTLTIPLTFGSLDAVTCCVIVLLASSAMLTLDFFPLVISYRKNPPPIKREGI